MTNCITGDTAHRPAGSAPASPTTRRALPLLLGPLLAASGLSITHNAQAIGETTRVSVDSAGTQGNHDSYYPSISADGRFVAFESYANNLVPGDTNDIWDAGNFYPTSDIFVNDRRTHQTTRVSLDSAGNQTDSDSHYPVLSADGRFVAFSSSASNLVPGDTNGADDIFLHDRQTHQTTRVNIDSAGNQANAYTDRCSAISGNGRFVAFSSSATNLVRGDTNKASDIFVHDRQTHRTTRVSVDSAGNQGNQASGEPSLSADGRFVAFSSSASNLVPGDTNFGNGIDIFVYDRQTHETTRVSVDSAGNQSNGDYTTSPSLSADGRFVSFASRADNLVPGDTNSAGDTFVHDRLTHQTTRINVDSSGSQANEDTWHDVVTAAPISADGRFVVFSSAADNLVPDDTNLQYYNDGYDVFVRDRLLDRTATADLAITQTVSPDPFQSLSPLTYTLTAVNKGLDTAGEVTLYDRPPSSGTLVSAVPSQGQCSSGAPVVCYLGTLAPGASSTVTLTIKPKWQGVTSLWNTAHTNAAPVDSNVANNKATLRVDVAP